MLPEGAVPEFFRVWQRDDETPWRLGDGVYKASDLRTNEVVALRFFDATVDRPGDKAALARLAQKLSGLRSPNVVALRDVFIRARTHLAVVEFVEGPSLADRVRAHGAGTSETVLALGQVALEALATLHAAGVAHGSVGPSKLLFSREDGLLKLSDGGLHRGAVEVAPPTGNDATADDLRRLGVTLWFALTGTPPFAAGLDAPPEAVPKWEQVLTLPASPSLWTLMFLFAQTLHRGERVPWPLNATVLLAALETRTSKLQRVGEPDPPEPRPPDESVRRENFAAPEPEAAFPVPASATRRRSRTSAGAVALLALTAGLTATWFSQLPPAGSRPAGEPTTGQTGHATAAAPTPAEGEERSPLIDPATPPLASGPAVSAAGIQARAAGVQTRQPDTLEALKPARELRRVATLPVPDGQRFPDEATVDRVAAALARSHPPTTAQRTSLVLVLGCSDEPDAEAAAKGSQEEADALAGALFHAGINAPVYACGLGNFAGIPEVDTEAAGSGGFVEVWVAFLLF